MNRTRTNILLWGLTALSAVLLSVPYLVPHTGAVALVAFIPLLMMDRIASLTGTRRVWVYHYSAFVLWNAMTTFWVCNATVGGGIFAILANAFQMSVIFSLFRFSKRYFTGTLPYLFLAAMWIAWERVYFDVDISWPWLVLGNAFAGSTGSVQWYEYTGTLGGSLWIWASNLALFGLFVSLSDGSFMERFNLKAKVASVAGYLLLVIVPPVVSHCMYKAYEEEEHPFEVVALQPNIDPYHKFEAMSQADQNRLLLRYAEQALADRPAGREEPLLLLAPETFTNDVWTNNLQSGPTYRVFTGFLDRHPGVNLLFGASSHDLILSESAPSYTARKMREGTWIESHNSALMTDGTGRVEIFHKNKLVVAVEKMPYPAFFSRIDDLLGGVMGRCIGQDGVSLLHCQGADGTVVPVGSAICYESVYGEYYTSYVRAGAQVMTVITNDAWWGDTPGYRQHLRYACLRAIETRRSIARCANTGISALIDQRGDIISRTGWWQPAVLKGKLNLNEELTFFVKNGDITGRACVFLFWMFAAALLVRVMTSARNRRD